MVIKEYKRLDNGQMIDVVLDHVNFFTEALAKKKDGSSSVAAAMGNGTVLWLDVSLTAFRAAMKAVKR